MQITRSSTETVKGPADFMTHIAIQEADESGSPVTWGEHVTDAEYEGASRGTTR
jgi:hypothetical protein